MQAELETGAAAVETWPPAGTAPRSWGWGTTVPSITTAGLLVILCSVLVIVYFVRGLRRRQDIWEPLWLGFLALALGLTGTVHGVIESLGKFAAVANVTGSFGGAGPLELAVGAAKALVPTFLALSVLSAAIFCSLILWRRRLLPAPSVTPRARRPEDN